MSDADLAPPLIVATYHGIEVPTAQHLSRRMIESMEKGRFERREISAGLAAIPPGSRILELGAGSGVVGAVIAKGTRAKAALSIEANPFLIDHARALYAHNGLAAAMTIRHGILLTAADAPASVDFFVQGNFLASGMVARKAEKAVKVSVPVIRYAGLKAEFPHDVIMMDIEGGELDFLRHADLTGVHTFITEVHRDIYGREGVRECRRLLEAAGFAMNDEMSRIGVHVFRRVET